ncbi:MAG: hypothetical protein H6719_30900 [Sandaracinaceae bacterium]|nr:hypothetical protein [Sandaracinaceae bacterium]
MDAALVDASVDAATVDACVATIACRVDADGDGFAQRDSDVVLECACPEGRSAAPDAPLDCGDGTPEAHPGQTDYFVTRFPNDSGAVVVNSFDYDCDGTEELRPLVSGMCRLGLAGSCPAEEGPWMYDPSTTECDHLVQWARCETDCSSTILGMQQVGCH